MSTIERANRCGVLGSELWQLDLGGVARRRRVLKRHLVLEPYDAANVTQLNAWIEEQRVRYIWESDSPDHRPSGPASYAVHSVKLDNTHRHGCAGIHSLGFTLIRALARGQIVGDVAVEAMHGLFWAAFVDNDDGLAYLNRHASETVGSYYARQRLSWCLRRELGKRAGTLEGDIKNPVARLIDDVTNEHEPMLGLTAWQRALVDDAFYDALEAFALTSDPPAVRDKQVLAFLKLHKPKRSREPI